MAKTPTSDRLAGWTQFVASRRSTRDFLPTAVSNKVIDELLTDAMTAPSWSNTRPYLVAVATGDVRDRLSAEFCARWDGLAAARANGIRGKIRIALTRVGLPTSNVMIARPYRPDLAPRARKVGKELYALLGVQRGDKVGRDAQWRRNYEFFGAPVELFVFTHKSLGKFAASDAGLFMQNLMLSAHAKGLGTCAQGAVAIWEDAVRAEFDVPKQYSLLCGIAVGHPSDAAINTFKAERLPIEEIKVKPKLRGRKI